MSSYTVAAIADAKNWFTEKGWPGEMKFLKHELQAEQVSVSYRRMPKGSGGKGGYGHKHHTQEEVFLVLKGTAVFKLDDDVFEVGPMTAVRVAPAVYRSIDNDHDEVVELLIISTRCDDLEAETEFKQDFWPAD